ncbi:hypothetical protein GJ496_011207 [Pomphorhynchus laevis]|nr:hypothetical protein GJ496_011207 [Pomphorhynchus laevis]
MKRNASKLATSITSQSKPLDKFLVKRKFEILPIESNIVKESSTFLGDIIIKGNLADGWLPVMQTQLSKPYFKELSEFLQHEISSKNEIYPTIENMFTFAKCCAFNNIKVVILGQDPYHQPNQAHGLSFSVPKGTTIPPSLRNIYKEISNTTENFKIPNHGYLQSWAKQGVLLLNACLSVRRNMPNSHKDKGWERFTDYLVKAVDQQLSNVVFLLWGAYAKKKSEFVSKKNHCVLTAAHPSPLSANSGFFGCNHFSKTNDYLAKHGLIPIDWNSINDLDIDAII